MSLVLVVHSLPTPAPLRNAAKSPEPVALLVSHGDVVSAMRAGDEHTGRLVGRAGEALVDYLWLGIPAAPSLSVTLFDWLDLDSPVVGGLPLRTLRALPAAETHRSSPPSIPSLSS